MGSTILRCLVPAAMILSMILTGCSFKYYAEPLKPLDEAAQGESKTVLDDGSVVFTKARLEVRIRPMLEEELNRQFAGATERGTNPYTFGTSKVFRSNETPQRFTVFRIGIKNYEYPKVHLDPTKVYITTSSGRKYFALSYEQLNNYYRGYSLGGTGGQSSGSSSVSGDRRGNERQQWLERTDLLKRSMLPDEATFSGQEKDGYIVFRPLASEVSDITVNIPDFEVRFDYKGEPIETIDIDAQFGREVGKVYPDGRRESM